MSDDEDRKLRGWLADAHRDEATPPFRGRRRAVRARLFWLSPVALAAAVLLVLWLRPRPPAPEAPPELASLRIESRGPLDFLLEMPSDQLLRSTPRFDAKGGWR